MKKTACFIVLLLFCTSAGSYALEYDIQAGLSGVGIINDCTSFKSETEKSASAGGKFSVTETTAALKFDATAGNYLNRNFYYYAHVLYVPEIVYRSKTSTDLFLFTMDSELSAGITAFYAGAGMQYVLPLSGQLSLFAGADMGYKNTSITEKATISAMGTVISSGAVSRAVPAFGFAVNAGAKYYFPSNIYAVVSLGYDNINMGFGGSLGAGMYFGRTAAESRQDEKNSGESAYNRYISGGDSLYAGKEYKKASSYYAQALKFSKKAEAYVKIGDCCMQMGYTGKAVQYYRYSLSLENNPKVRAIVERLDKNNGGIK